MFVPGGRILKNESIDSAFKRILLAETGHRINEQDEQYLLGVYEHFYDDSFWDEKISTHYIVLAYRIKLRTRFLEKLDKQHDLLEWLSIDELLSRSDVYKNVKAYFNECPLRVISGLFSTTLKMSVIGVRADIIQGPFFDHTVGLNVGLMPTASILI